MNDIDGYLERARSLYQQWLTNQGFKEREGQWQMIKFVCSILVRDKNRLGIVEAGTGTGKTIAYSLPAILAARAAEKKVVIVAPTVLLQEQLMNQELLQLKEILDTDLRFGLVKGRRRYVCVDRLEKLSRATDVEEFDILKQKTPSALERQVATKLLSQFETKEWDGNMDSIPGNRFIYGSTQGRITTDSRGCYRQTCKHAASCPYYQVRNHIADLDVIVTNYSLLLSASEEDLDILPDASDCIYIFDESHQLIDIVERHRSGKAELHKLLTIVSEAIQLMSKLENTPNLEISTAIRQPFQRLNELHSNIERDLEKASAGLDAETRKSEYKSKSSWSFNEADPFVLNKGIVPDELSQSLKPLLVDATSASNGLKGVNDAIKEQLEEETPIRQIGLFRKLQDAIGNQLQQCDEIALCLGDWLLSEDQTAARWFKLEASKWSLYSTPVDSKNRLDELFWSQAYGVICTSASIDSADGFNNFIRDTGFHLDKSNTLRIKSPFKTKEKVTFRWADMDGVMPTSYNAFNEKMVEVLPELLQLEQSCLVLFTSKAALQYVVKKLPKPLRDQCLVQLNTPIETLVEQHKQRIDEGKSSYLLGLRSFREGLDLPGHYCRHIVITKVPFPVPSDPVLTTKKELATDLVNPFMELDVNLAGRDLYQSCGRLLRNESDFGTITMLDRRPLERRYRNELLGHLPEYTQVDMASTSSS